jgi:hypothetical protein
MNIGKPSPIEMVLPVGIEQPDGEILRFVNNHVICGAHEVGFHFIGDRDDRTADHLGGEGIDLGVVACL